MSEFLVTAILLGLGFGQVKALYRGMPAAITYYICVAPLGYFSIWKFGRWDPDRLCGLIILLGSAMICKRDEKAPKFYDHPLFVLLLYVVFATMVMAPLWPVETMQVNSAIHGVLRPAISIANWTIVLGMAWKIAMVFRMPGMLSKCRGTILWSAVFLCLYAVYQTVAVRFSLPVTGLRVAAGSVTADQGGEVFASYSLLGETIFRPCSFIGEPKSLGAACLFWLALLLSGMFDRRWETVSIAILVLIGYTLWLTASTGAWLGTLASLSLFVYVSNNVTSLNFNEKMAFVGGAGLVAVGLVFFVGGSLADELGDSRLTAIFEERFLRRLASDDGDLMTAENLEAVALQVLMERPNIIVFGNGLGGITYYMSDHIGDLETSRAEDGSSLVLSPTIGVLSMLCDIGVIGFILLYLSVRKGIAYIRSHAEPDRPAVVLAFVGTMTLIAVLIHAPPAFTAISVGLLIAASFHTVPALSRHARDLQVI